MVHNPCFSFGRLGQLLKMEWFANRRSVLLFSLIFTIAVFAVQTFFVFLLDRDWTTFFPNIMSTYPVFSIALTLYGFMLINRRMNRSDTVAHTILPATALEKFIVFVLIYFFFTILIWMCNQLCYTISYTLSAAVTTLNAAPGFEWHNPFTISDTLRYGSMSSIEALSGFSTGALIVIEVSTLLYTLGSYLLPAVYMRKNVPALLMAMAMQIAMIMVVSFVAVSIKETQWLQNTTDTVADFIWIISVPFGLVGLIYLLLAYRTIKRKQLRS